MIRTFTTAGFGPPLLFPVFALRDPLRRFTCGVHVTFSLQILRIPRCIHCSHVSFTVAA